MRLRWGFAVAAVLPLIVPGCDPQLDSYGVDCASSTDCPYTTACDPRVHRCVEEPQGFAFGSFSCHVFDAVTPSGSPSTSDVVGVIDGLRTTFQGGAACYPTEIALYSPPAANGTSYTLIIALPKDFAGGKVALDSTNAWVQATGGGLAETLPIHGVAAGELDVTGGYAVGLDARGSVVFTPTRACGQTVGGFCPSGERCASLLNTNVKDGVCTPLPVPSTCAHNVECPIGTNCIGGQCRTLCTGTMASECSSSEACAAVESPTFLAKQLGACEPVESVAKWHDPCPAGVSCLFNSTCVDAGMGPICSDFCQSSLSCAKGFGCIPLTNGQDVCVAGAANAGESCATALCVLTSVCIDTDKICHEYCTSDDGCPPARPKCVSLQSGNFACAAP